MRGAHRVPGGETKFRIGNDSTEQNTAKSLQPGLTGRCSCQTLTERSRDHRFAHLSLVQGLPSTFQVPKNTGKTRVNQKPGVSCQQRVRRESGICRLGLWPHVQGLQREKCSGLALGAPYVP